jgi:polysaccharide biosynthesis transport protein
MPDGSFFQEPTSPTRAHPGGARESGRGPPAAQRGAGPSQQRRTAAPEPAAVGFRMPRTLAEYVGLARRRWQLILGVAAAFSAAGLGATWQTTTLFHAEAVVLLDTRDVHIADIGSVLQGRSFDSSAVRGEIEVLKSPSLAARVVEKLRLEDQPEIGGAAASPAAPDEPHRRVQRAIDSLVDRVAVQNDGRSFVLRIGFSARNPALAAQVVNAYAELYLEHQVAVKDEATRRAAGWL